MLPTSGEIIEEENIIENQEKIEASDTQPIIVMIPTDKIKPCRWGTGIRDQEIFEQLKENIKKHSLNSPLRVFPLDNGFYELYIGDHRLLICRDLGWKEVPCFIDEIDENQALEKCLSDNICRAGYSSVELENRVTGLWNSGRYQAKEMLGRAIGLTGQRIGQLIGAGAIRNSAKIPFDASISTQTIVDTSPLENLSDKLALLELVRKKTITSGEVKNYARTLSKMSEDTRRKVLYEGQSLTVVVDGKMSLLKKNVSTSTQVANPNLLPEIYNLLNGVQDHVALIKDPTEKKQAIAYVKFYTALFLKVLWKEGVIHQDFFESVVRHELDIDKSQLHHFDGLRIKGVDWWLSSPKDDSEAVSDLLIDEDQESDNGKQAKPNTE